MQSQTYPRRPALTAPDTRPAAGAAQAIPPALYWLLALAVGSSFYVAVEPAPTDLLFLVLFVAVLTVRRLRFPLDLNPLLGGGLLVFIAASALSLLWSQDVERGAFYLSVTFYLLASWYVVVVLLANYGPPLWTLILRAFLVAATIVALIGLISHFTPVLQDQIGLQSPYGERARGTFKDPNVYGPFLCAALLLVINRIVTRGFSLPLVALMCLFSVEILAAFSRGAYVNIAVALGLFLVLQLLLVRRRDWTSRTLAILAVGLFLVLPAIVLFLHTTGLDDFLRYRLQLQHYDATRFDTQEQALVEIGQSPFGIGPGQTERELPISTHNLYLRVAIENGIPAIFGFLLFLAATLWVCLRGSLRRGGQFRDLYVCCLAILGGILVNSMVIDSLHWRHLFLFLAVPVGLWQHELWAARAAQRQRRPRPAAPGLIPAPGPGP